MIVESKDLNTKDAQGVALIHVAASNGWMDALTLLVQKNVDLNVQDSEGNTSLHLASFFQHYRVVELLGKHGANTEIKNRHLETPIVMTEDVTMIRLLKALKSNSKVNVDEAENKRSRLDSAVKCKSLQQKKKIGMADILREGKEIESNYAELEFSRKKREAREAAEKAGNDGTDGPEPQITYASIDHDSAAAAVDPESMYAKPVKTPKGEEEENENNKNKVTGEGGAIDGSNPPPLAPDVVQKHVTNPRVNKHKQLTSRKGSLAAIAIEAERQKDEDEKGGCCTIS